MRRSLLLTRPNHATITIRPPFVSKTRRLCIPKTGLMVSKRLAVVLGADSGQGASVENALLKSGRYRIRGIPRIPGSEGARELARKGVDVVEADFDRSEERRVGKE